MKILIIQYNIINTKMSIYEKFQRDLIVGQHYEKLASEILISYLQNGARVLSFNDDYKYDFITSHSFKYEVKLNTSQTVVFIEYLAFKKPSGLSISEADFHIFVIPKALSKDLYLLISTNEIQQIISKKLYKMNYVDKLKSGYILDIHTILKNSININE
jgi:hypothetical protein